MRPSHNSTALVLALVVATQACAGARGRAPAPEPTSSGMADLEALYRARQDSALRDVHPADVEFMAGMIHHHAQALVMSAFAPANGASPSVRTLAARIINAQTDEIANMQRWLRDRDQPAPEVDEAGTVRMPGGGAAGMHGEAHEMFMPGMLTAEQMRELEQARDSNFDRLFLTYMIQHHKGAVTMVHDLFATDGAAQDDMVFKIASDIQVDQITEINRMQQMLDALPAAPTSD
ncbi:MAG: DUF305 domain-containing protein [Gemmatimonadota bacterium]